MTKEQLQKTAENNASLHFSKAYSKDEWTACVISFIAGAASRESGCRWVEQELKELNLYLDALSVQTEKDAGSLWTHFTDKFEAFKKRLLSESAALPEEGDDAILFAEFLNKNHMAFDGFGGWVGKINTNHYGSSSKQLYSLFKQRK